MQIAKELYTVDGHPYRLKVATKTVFLELFPATNDVFLIVEYNFPENPVFDDWRKITLNTSQPILPLLYNFAAIKLDTHTVEADIGSPFYSYTTNGQRNAAHLPGASKVLAQARINDYASEIMYHYAINYENINLSSKDFLGGNIATRFRFEPYQAFGFAGEGAQLGVYGLNIPAGDYSFAITFLYFELQDEISR